MTTTDKPDETTTRDPGSDRPFPGDGSPTADAAQVDGFAKWFNELLSNVEIVIKGKRDEVAMALVCLFAEGHLLIEDVPGTGKTALAKTIAASIDGTYSRIQFTPDLLPSDVTGGLVYHQKDGSFELHRGPVFANVVLADEINRASPKTQAALLEVMEEQQVTVGNESNPVPRPFIVIATQNPVEQAGTYRLPEAQLDRFLMRTSLGYLDEDDEVDVLRTATQPPLLDPAESRNQSGNAIHSENAVNRVLPIDGVAEMIRVAGRVHVDERLQRYIVQVVAMTRTMPELRLGVSTRGALGLLRCSRALAASQGREYVKADDVKILAPSILAHRMLLTSDAELKRVDCRQLVDRVLDTVDVPTATRTH